MPKPDNIVPSARTRFR